jgi:hypothetical protein
LYLGYQVHPGHAGLVDDVIGWYDAAAAGVRQTATYRGDLHILVEAPDGTMAASTIIWLDEANKTAQFEPVGTHPGYRRLRLGTAMLLHGMHLARVRFMPVVSAS